MGRFIYEDGDVEIADSQCSLCIYFDDAEKKCEKIGLIPEDILGDKRTCEDFEYEDKDSSDR